MAWIKRTPNRTPWYDITGLLSGVTSGQLLVMREHGTVWLDFQNLVVTGQGTAHVGWRGVLPVGLRPPRTYAELAIPQRAAADTAGPARVDIYGGIDVYRHSGPIRGLVSFRTEQPMPTGIPGAVVIP